VGPSAHSFIGGDRFFNPASLDDYLRDDLRAAGSSRQKEPRGDGERRLEELMLGLRTSAGYPLARLAEKAEVIQRLIDGGLGARSGGNLVLTPRGFLVLNEIVHRLHAAA
jgi:oxygen-independent coproporphyrinogen-3 oxidase